MTPITRNSIGMNGEVFDDRRFEPRRRVLKGGRLTFNSGYGVFDCTIRNQSEHGARLSFGDTAGVPTTFELQISGEAEPRTARVRWRNPVDIGVTFE